MSSSASAYVPRDCSLEALYRAIATRYDKTVAAFLGAVHLAASIVWLN
jgi:transposase